MKQLVRIKKDFILADVPAPVCESNGVLVRNKYSLHLPEVEKNVLEANTGNIISKILKQKELLNFVYTKMKKDGLRRTYAFGKAMMANWHTLGALCLGEVIEKGKGVIGISVGDKVVCTGWHQANHADYVSVPAPLVAKVPSSLTPELALLIPYGAKLLALIRFLQIKPTQTILVYGGNLGAQLFVSLLEEQGYSVFTSPAGKAAVDYIFTVHSELSGEDTSLLRKVCSAQTKYIAISEKKMNSTIATNLGCSFVQYPFFLSDRKLHLGNDEGRSILETIPPEEVARFLKIAKKRTLFKLEKMATIPFSRTPELYTAWGVAPVMIEYTATAAPERTVQHFSASKPAGTFGIAVIGAGNMARNVHLPILCTHPHSYVKYIFTHSGRSAASMAIHYHLPYSTSSYVDVLKDPEIDAVVILTHHSTHASYALQALKAGKSVFTEKPLCLTEAECKRLQQAYAEHPVTFSVGFNKTFSPLAQEAQAFFANRKHPLFLSYRLQAPLNLNKPWYYDPAVGGGRLLGEYCHLFDFASWMVGKPVSRISVAPLSSTDPYFLPDSNVVVTLSFEDGSVATLLCSEDGTTNSPKERIELISDNNMMILEDWESITLNGKHRKTAVQKGYTEHWDNFFANLQGEKVPLVEMERAATVFRLSFEAHRKLKKIIS